MPGANCAIPGCTTSRAHSGVAIFRIPVKDDEYHSNWRNNVLAVIKRVREVDPLFKKQIDNRNVYICEKHYTDDKLIRCKLILFIFYLLFLYS